MELASLNCKNNIDVIVNQFFRELPKRWMLLQNTTEKRRLQIRREKPYISHMTRYRIPKPPQPLFLNVQRNARPTSRRKWHQPNKQIMTKKIIRASARL